MQSTISQSLCKKRLPELRMFRNEALHQKQSYYLNRNSSPRATESNAQSSKLGKTLSRPV